MNFPTCRYLVGNSLMMMEIELGESFIVGIVLIWPYGKDLISLGGDFLVLYAWV